MLHYEPRVDTWFLNGHAVDPCEDFAAIRRACRDSTEDGDQQATPTREEQAELNRAIVREAIARVWSQDELDILIRARLAPHAPPDPSRPG